MNSMIKKNQWILCAFLLTSCGFGAKDADPMADRDKVLVSAQEKSDEADLWRQRCASIEADYQASLGQHQQAVDRINKSYNDDLEKMKSNYDSAVVKSQKDFNDIRDQFVADLESLKKQCDDVQAELQSVIAEQQVQLNKYKEQAETFEAQDFRGALMTFNPVNAQPRYYRYAFGESRDIQILSSLAVNGAEEAITGFKIKTSQSGKSISQELPVGLKLEKLGKVFTLSGSPKVDIPNDSREVILDLEFVPVIDYSKITSESVVSMLKAEDLTRNLSLIIEKSTKKPSITDVTHSGLEQYGEVIFTIVVNDPSSEKIAPQLIFTKNEQAGTTVANGTPFLTFHHSADNPKSLGDNKWTYTYILHKSLFPDHRTRSMGFKIEAQSLVSGLISEKPHIETFHLKGAR